jgi:hypothetical protein
MSDLGKLVYKRILLTTHLTTGRTPTTRQIWRKVRVPNCHPTERHYGRGFCEPCYWLHIRDAKVIRRKIEAAERLGLKAPEEAYSTCEVCRRKYALTLRQSQGREPVGRFCGLRCQFIDRSMAPGDAWRTEFPGARYQFLRNVPETCEKCSGQLFESESGVTCALCGRVFPVAESLARGILLGYDDAYAATPLEAALANTNDSE